MLADVILHTDLSKAANSDRVADTLDYAKVADFLLEVADESRFELLEALANRLMQALFEQFSLSKVKIKICKPNILPNAQSVSIEMERTAP